MLAHAQYMFTNCNQTTMPSNLRHDHRQRTTFTRQRSYANLTHIPWRYMGCSKMNLLYVKAFESHSTAAC